MNLAGLQCSSLRYIPASAHVFKVVAARLPHRLQQWRKTARRNVVDQRTKPSWQVLLTRRRMVQKHAIHVPSI